MKTIKKIIALVLTAGIIAASGLCGVKAADNETAADTSFIPSSITCNRLPFQPIYVKLNGKAYNILSPVGAIGAMIAAKTEQQRKAVAFSYLELVFTDIINVIAGFTVESADIQKLDDYVSENFSEGHSSFLRTAASGWSLGYSSASLLPDDILSGNKKYYLAGYLLQNFPGNDVQEVLDDMKVRTIVMDDGSGRGKVAFATIECIGIANADIRAIREQLKEFAERNNIISINVQSTHCHSEIDTLGLWNPFFLKIAHNSIAGLTGKKLIKNKSGVDREFMQLLTDRTAQTIREATDSMESGKLYYCAKDGSEYSFDKRDPSSFDGTVYRLRFAPNDAGKRETLIVNMAAHPYVTGLKTEDSSGKQLSGDYTAYMDEIITQAGYNFMFFNGAILGIYEDRGPTGDGVPTDARWQQTERYGREMSYFVLSMTKTLDEINQSDYVDFERIERESKDNEYYTLWCKDWEPVEETEVEPILNIILNEVTILVENPIIKAAGKLGLVDHTILKKGRNYYSVTEIGYLEIGEHIKVAMMPGEISPELIYGGGTIKGDQAFSCCDFNEKTVAETLELKDDDVLLCFGLANDEIGYILNDNDYCLLFFDDVQPFGDHYQESIAFGRSIGSTLMKAFEKMIGEIK